MAENTKTISVAALSKPSTSRWLAEAAWDWAVIALAFAVMKIWPRFFIFPLGIVVIASRQHALSFLGHDGAHFRLTKRRWLNDGLTGLFASWPMGAGLNGYRQFHFKHHTTLGTSEDPELPQRRWAAPQWNLPKSRAQVALYLLRDLTGLAIVDIYFFARVMGLVGVADRVGPLVWWAIALPILYRTGNLWMAGVWWFSIFSGYWAVFRLRMWCEHIGTDGTHRVRANWWQKALFQPHGAWCHYEHHRWPSVPCWNLPRLRQLAPEVPELTIGELWRRFESSETMIDGVPGQTELVKVGNPVSVG